jgi:2-polyprenyl-6-methoxyphenol hydroxylase-like FAD-dependent oxidoreductase
MSSTKFQRSDHSNRPGGPRRRAGQGGASIACKDAIVLAECLRDLPGGPSAFTAYGKLRRQRVERVVAYARKRGSKWRGCVP